MRCPGDVIRHIHTSTDGLRYIAVELQYYERIRDEAKEYCEVNEEPFSSLPELTVPHFLVYGVPIIAGGHA